MRCHSCENKKTPADCLVSPQFNLDNFHLDLRNSELKIEYRKFYELHQWSQLSCLAECFLMDGNWCNSRLPIPNDRWPQSLPQFANYDLYMLPYDTVAQTRFQSKVGCVFPNSDGCCLHTAP